jgi:N-acetylneuraminic acid mutarotase
MLAGNRCPALLKALALAAVALVSSVPTVPVAASASAAPAGPPNTWIPTTAMAVARAGQTATLLGDGTVLVAGGGTESAALYDPAGRTWSPAGHMSAVRTGATATRLLDGRVLVAGGCCHAKGAGLKTAELYDPARGTWRSTGSLTIGRSGHTATLLRDGRVLVTGGGCQFECSTASFFNSLASAELYDPATGVWTRARSMHEYREFHSATLLINGTVLVTGGFAGCDDTFCTDAASAETFDPATGVWTVCGSMHVPREQHTASLLPDGHVLVAGGLNHGGFGNGARLDSAELYDPAAGMWSTTASMAAVHSGHTATPLPNGRILVAGGEKATAELYEPSKAIWVSPGSLSTVRTGHTATLLRSGRVLVTGGYGPDGQPLATAEIYLNGPGPLVSVTPTSLPFITQPVGTRSAVKRYTVTNDGTTSLYIDGVEITGKHPGDFAATTTCADAPVQPGGSCTVSVRFQPRATGLREAHVAIADNAPLSPQGVVASGYGSGPNAWAPTASMSTPRDTFTATLLRNGTVLVAGGKNKSSFSLAAAELYDPASRSWRPTGSLNTQRSYAVATLLGDGDVLVSGGIGPNFVNLASAELYHPARGTWTLTGAMQAGGHGLTSTLLAGGEVLVTGQGPGSDAEVYNPATGTWALTGPMTMSRSFATATLLPGGTVLVAAGATASAELYDPGTNAWTATGSLHTARQGHTATLLPNGKVLVEGGVPSGGGTPISSAELYDPGTGTWTATGTMSVGRYGQTATLLRSGMVLVAGGCSGYCNPGVNNSTEFYDPASGYWFLSASMTMPREQHSATLLKDGTVLAAGGDSASCCSPTAAAELYIPA